MRWARNVVLAWLALPVLFVLWLAFFTPEPVPGVEIERTGYFKDEDRNRVMAYVASRDLTRDEAEKKLDRVVHTDGAETVAVIYGPDARDPGHILTTSESGTAASRLIAAPPFDGWSWYVLIEANGARQFGAR